MEFRVLGELEVVSDGVALPLGGRKQRAFLAVLLLHANEPVARGRLIDEVWGEEAPATVASSISVYVSRLRKLLAGAGPTGVSLVTTAAGYALELPPEQLDLLVFQQLVREGEMQAAADEFEPASRLFAQALSMWRGPPLADLVQEPFARREAARLEELRLAAVEARNDVELACGRHRGLVPELELLAREHPYRERLCAQLMLALYRSGRRADALECYRRTRKLMVDALGLDPTPELQEMERAVLRDDPSLLQPTTAPAATEQETPLRRARWPVAGAAVAVLAIALVGAAFALKHAPAGAARARDVVVLTPRGRASSADGAIQQQLAAGLAQAQREYGVPTRLVLTDGSTALSTFRRIQQTHPRLIVVFSQWLTRRLAAAIARHPETRVALLDSDATDAGSANTTRLVFANRDAGFLAGYLAARMARERPGQRTISVVGGPPVQPVNELLAGFQAGARHADPSVRVLVGRSPSFEASALCQQLASRQIDAGSTVVFDAAGPCGVGAVSAAGVRDVDAIGVDEDMSYMGDHVIASVQKRFDRAVVVAVARLVAGNLPRGKTIRLGLHDGAVGLVGVSSRVPGRVRRDVASVADALLARDDRVPAVR